MNARTLTEAESAVIEAAQDYADAIRAAQYGPGGHLVQQAEKALLVAVDDLQAGSDGGWIPLGTAAARAVDEAARRMLNARCKELLEEEDDG